MDERAPRTWTAQSRMTDPGRHRGALARLPAGAGPLAGVVQGLLVHAEERDAYGLPPIPSSSRATLPVADRLAAVLAHDDRPLDRARSPEDRSAGTCRDFALLLCCFLRHGGVPARVRCGFAAYLGVGWRDHWVCEHWDEAGAVWRIADAQMDAVMRDRYGVDFDPADVPRPLFRTAGEAWTAWRSGRAEPSLHGHGPVVGAWFMKVNVVRDYLALAGREVSSWDDWRDAPAARRVVAPDEMEGLDRIARHPDRPCGDVAPDWRARGSASGPHLSARRSTSSR